MTAAEEDLEALKTPGRVTDHYNVGKEIGGGAFSSVREATHKKTGEKVAIKMCMKKHPSFSRDKLVTECKHMGALGSHVNIIELKGLYETTTTYDLVIEYTHGHELFDVVIQRAEARANGEDPRPYSEKEAAFIFRQAVAATHHCHTNGILHRELSPENFLASEDAAMDPLAPIKLRNFKSAVECEAGSSVHTLPHGHPEYAAVEVVTKPYAGYGHPADVWSLGVILYVLVCGYPPFYGDSNADIIEMVQTAVIDFPDEEWSDGE